MDPTLCRGSSKHLARLVACASIAVSALTSSSASAADPPTTDPQAATTAPTVGLFGVPRCTSKQLCWAPSFNRVDVPELVLTGAAAGVALATNIAHPLNTGWNGGILFDDQVRSALRVGSFDTQLEIRSGTDLGLALITTYPIVVDSLLVAYWYRGSADVALQMALIDAEAFAITGAIEGASNFLSGRTRPYQADCADPLLSKTGACLTDTTNRSFFSGHSAISFTAAALICAHHEELHLFDSAADHVACISGLLAAGTIGTLRIVSDAHYFSDVFVGAVVGTAVGLTIPLLHHYRGSGPSKSTASTFRVNLVPGIGSAQLVGTF